MSKAEKIMLAIEASKRNPTWRLIAGLGIRGVGESGSKALAKHYKTFRNIKDASIKDIMGVDGIGAKIAKSIHQWFLEPDNKFMLDTFKKNGVCPGAFQ